MLEWAMSHPSFKTQLFRFVDVFPATTDDADVLRHLDEYFEAGDVPRLLDLGLGRGRARAVRQGRRRVGGPPQHRPHGRAVHRRRRRRRGGRGAAPALAQRERVHRRPARREDGHREPRPTATRRASTSCSTPCSRRRRTGRPTTTSSATTSARCPGSTSASSRRRWRRSYSPLTRDDGLAQAKARLRPILRRGAPSGGAFVYLDMEHYDVKDLTLAALPRAARRAGVRGPRGRRRHPGLPEGLAPTTCRPDRVVGAGAAARSPCGW